MTIIVALHEPGKGTWIGSDRQVSYPDGDVASLDKPKWVVRNGIAVGCSGQNAFLDLVAHHAGEFDPQWSGFGLHLWAREKMREFGAAGRLDDEGMCPPRWDISFVLATPSMVASVDAAGGTWQGTTGEILARGSGAEYALGADFMGKRILGPEQRVHNAVKAACALDSGCGGEPFVKLLPLA